MTGKHDRPAYSVSSLVTYERCRRQYYYQYVLGFPPPRTPAMTRGTGVHGLISRHLRGKAVPDRIDPDVIGLFDVFRESRFNLAPVASEKPFVLPTTYGLVRGRIDIILPAPGGGLELVDIKSGASRSREEVEQHLQLPLYAIAASKVFGLDPELIAYTYVFLGSNEEHTFAFGKAQAEGIRDRIDQILTDIQSGNFEPRLGCECFACLRARSRRAP